MKYGSFSKDYMEYVITTPDTPRDWDNHMSNDEYGMRINQIGEGYSLLPDADGNKVTYYHPDTHEGKYVYVRDRDTEKFWSSNFAPVKKSCKYFECRHGIGYTTFNTETEKIQSSLTLFVPPQDPVELWIYKVKNTDTKKRKLSIFPFIEWQLSPFMEPWDNYAWYTKCNYNQTEKLIVCSIRNPRMIEKIYQGFAGIDCKFTSYECKRSGFFGGNTVSNPKAVINGKLSKSAVTGGERAVGIFQVDLELKPNEEKTINLIMGFSKDAQKRSSYVKKYLGGNKTGKALLETKKFWQVMIDRNKITTPDEKFNAMSNIWLKSNLHTLIRILREGYKGSRDTFQDVMANCHLDRNISRKRLLQMLSKQYPDGKLIRQWCFSTGRDDTRLYNDIPVWAIFATAKYVKETGDFKILDEKLPFYESSESGSVYEHNKRAMEFLLKTRGIGGLIRPSKGDWDDSLDGIDRKGKGISIWLSQAACTALLEMMEMAKLKGEKNLVEKYKKAYEDLKNKINKSCWDGQWYIRAISDNGTVLGSKKCNEGKVFLLPQAWAIISGTADEPRAKTCLDSVEKNLQTKYGPLLFTPAYQSYNENIGRLSIIPIAFGENGNIYIHAVFFYIMANLKYGRPDIAYDCLKKVSPWFELHDQKITKEPPYSLSNCYTGPENKEKFGETYCSWFSSSCSWSYFIVLEWFLGIRAEYDGLRVDPCLPSVWKKASVIRHFRKDIYEIDIKDNSKGQKKQIEIEVDSKIIQGNLIKPFNDGKRHKVQVHIK